MSAVQYKKCDMCGQEESDRSVVSNWLECAATFHTRTRQMDICAVCANEPTVRPFIEMVYPCILEKRVREEKLDAVFGKTHRFVPTIGVHGAFESLTDGSIVTYPEAVRRAEAS